MSTHDEERAAVPGTEERAPGDVPNPETGVGLGNDGEANTFEPEDDPDAVNPDDVGTDDDATA
ncbi:hypothetical protein [Georgenia faecalis]|uniref:Uncharacterized protein n=1 Tax=Georgenia faecalis TaxID=2483799 RepID=A0ABV9D7T3_9MICO|nr:hypothetical protein [Georgenia faecalis]